MPTIRSNHILCTIAVLLVSIGNNSCIPFVGANAPSTPPSLFGRGSNEDVPILNNIFGSRKQNRSSRNNNRRRRNLRKHDTDDGGYDVNESDDDDTIPFFLDQSDNIDFREQYEYDRMKRRRQRRKQQYNECNNSNTNNPLNAIRQWTHTKTGIRIPNVNVYFDPITILKLRKSWNGIIPGSIVRVGADFETHHRLVGGVWRLRACLEDKLIGGRFIVKGKRNGDEGVLLEYSKSWLFAGAGSLATRFNLNAQYDIKTNRCSARFGFRTENMGTVGSFVSSRGVFGGMGGGGGRQSFTIVPILPLDGRDGNVKLEVKTSIELPEPEIVVGMDLDRVSAGGSSSVAMGVGGDVDMEIEELNLIVDF